MAILSMLFLLALIVIACTYFNSRHADLWGLKGVLAGTGIFFLVRWGIPILFGLLHLALFLVVLAVIVTVVLIGVKLLAKHT